MADKHKVSKYEKMAFKMVDSLLTRQKQRMKSSNLSDYDSPALKKPKMSKDNTVFHGERPAQNLASEQAAASTSKMSSEQDDVMAAPSRPKMASEKDAVAERTDPNTDPGSSQPPTLAELCKLYILSRMSEDLRFAAYLDNMTLPSANIPAWE
jgi:hypothetical protein